MASANPIGYEDVLGGKATRNIIPATLVVSRSAEGGADARGGDAQRCDYGSYGGEGGGHSWEGGLSQEVARPAAVHI